MDWSDISINKFQEIYKAEQEGGEDLPFKILAIVKEKTLDDILNLPLSKLNVMMKDIAFYYREPKIPFVKFRFKLGDNKYRIFLKPYDMTVAQYIDFVSFAGDYSEHLARFLSTVIIPVGHKYGDGYDLDAVAEDIGKYLSVADGLAVASFFLTWSRLYAKIILKSSVRKLKALTKKEKDPELKAKLEQMLSEPKPTHS